ncbi:dna polymerase epsilon subunit c [Ophiostoma piceae UAMH 11346]|uniref:Dna polymerase epsilon subunit c n=1 Tax=Ophiostoma piceae (strain UAMH 11346) TaxID=1262450 RepID=S3C547_OPHP1|nr:dna polymerase epsilon subunit c [Ophiostoma piceae UAMH 11346]
MDFWSRLLSHTPLSAGPSRKDIAKDPLRRRHRFEKEYGQLLQTWRNSSNLIRDTGAADTIELRIQELTNILIDESRRPLPHTCLAFAAEKQIYIPISKIAATSYTLYIIKEAVYFFGILIESEDDAFVENETFATSLTNLFVRITGANSIHLDSETETKVVELAFNVTTKIRLRPDILPAWFKSRHFQTQQQDQEDTKEKESESHERFKGKTQRKDFPLFYILMDYIHSEGKVGDFARTGLLYIIESASSASSASLEQWIVESDLSTLMATGLGALYSQLSRKLVIDHPANNLPPVLALSDYEHPQPTFEAVNSCSPEFQVQLDTFLSHLLFWQDVLNHCRSVEVKSTLLEHFQVIFLQQLLYPSLLESSDIDGGSSVAVLTYLRRILESLDHPDMINLILHYLLALPDPSGTGNKPAAKNAASAARKRKSMDLATMMAAKPEIAATPFLFNLVDLVLACLKSHSQQTIYVTLQLISAILRRHHRYAVTTLLRTGPVSGVTTHRTIGAHQQDVEFFMSIAGLVGGQDNFDEVYDSILRDVIVRLESHPCSLKLIAPKVSANNHELPAIPDSLPGAPRDVPMHTIRPGDPLLETILDRLETFFVNSIDSNLAITEAILDLATCGFISLEGWILRHPDEYSYDTKMFPSSPSNDANTDNEEHELSPMKQCRRRPYWDGLPRFIVVLQALADQVSAYRQTIPRFDDLLQQRREAFQTADSPPPVLPVRNKGVPGNVPNTPVPDQPRGDEERNGSPARPSAFEAFTQRLMSEFNTPIRSGSPRGRKESSRGPFSTPLFGTPVGGSGVNSSATFSGNAFATPMSTKSGPGAPPVPPKEFPMNIDGTGTPSRGGSISASRSYSPGSQRRDPSVSSHDGRDSLVASQMAAFHAVDRQILARQVGIPVLESTETAIAKPIPIDFNKPAATNKTETKEGEETETEAKKLGDDVAAGGAGDEESPSHNEAEPHVQLNDGENGTDGDILPSENSDTAASTVEAAEQQNEATVTVSHVLTNAIILQSFLFEVAALLQARAGLFDEVRFA